MTELSWLAIYCAAVIEFVHVPSWWQMLRVTFLRRVYIEMPTWSLLGGHIMQAEICWGSGNACNLFSSAFVSEPP